MSCKFGRCGQDYSAVDLSPHMAFGPLASNCAWSVLALMGLPSAGRNTSLSEGHDRVFCHGLSTAAQVFALVVLVLQPVEP